MCLPIPNGRLPVRCLGLPLITTRLKSLDGEILKRIQSWYAKLLSFSGRAQLIQSVDSVLFSIQVLVC